MWKETLLSICLIICFQLSYAQPPGTVGAKLKAEAEAEKSALEQDYETRVRQEVLYGVYIPKDLAESFSELNKRTDADSRKKFTAMSEEDARHKLHFSLGRWIIHNWGFYGGSRLSKYLNDVGIFDPDDMARFIIITYHRELNGKPLGVKELVEGFQEVRKAEKEQRLKEGKVIHQETRKRPVKENN
ncbi:hypothetical protein CRP01_00360 [Flavilitoribacter nigricans DSM 23189 = NBRC 102662]|uniref:DUF6794 domain-containing protein n=2 Tax=Flavilitoribacter TaxID=2762562 RepID=A0A2D0NIX5_FLAN2|nr:hypothetical protein CRP01_00360 [Flavilitoribacter nigricans DSM 23189 = NBRC 102662]